LGATALDLHTTEEWDRTQDNVKQAFNSVHGVIDQGRQQISKTLQSQEETAVTEKVASAITVGSVYLAEQIEIGGHALTKSINKRGVVWRERSRLQKQVKIHPALLASANRSAVWSSKVEDVAEAFKGHVQAVKKAVAANIGKFAREVCHAGLTQLRFHLCGRSLRLTVAGLLSLLG
jgi:hypothetical protein